MIATLATGPAPFVPAGTRPAVVSVDARLAVTFADEAFHLLLNLPENGAPSPRRLGDVLAAAPALGAEAAACLEAACSAAVAGLRVEALHLAVGRPARDHRVQVSRTGPDTWTAFVAPAADPAPEATLDALTGLADRRQLVRSLDAALTAAEAGGNETAVLYVDLDRFKPINDTLGHGVGDALLRLVGRRLRTATREDDVVARLGGDEFAVLVPVLATGRDLSALARRVVDILGRPYLVDGHQVNVGASVGVARAPSDGLGGETLLRSADLALYHAKRAGRGTFSFFAPSMASRAQARRTMEIDLRKALALRQFELFYQPQIDLDRNAVIGFEALIRWRHPVHGLVSPANFIPLAEEIGFIAVLGEWALHEACREASRWPEGVAVAVNVSARQFEDCPKLIGAVAGALRASGLPGRRLEVEITESVLLHSQAAVLEALNALRAMGVRIAMDDFGTGYSSLSQLRSFPFDKLKIDRSFVAGEGDRASQNAVIRAISALGSSLGMATIAEGVETPDQLARIRAEGCGSVQGYLFSRPVPATELDGVLARFGTREQALPA